MSKAINKIYDQLQSKVDLLMPINTKVENLPLDELVKIFAEFLTNLDKVKGVEFKDQHSLRLMGLRFRRYSRCKLDDTSWLGLFKKIFSCFRNLVVLGTFTSSATLGFNQANKLIEALDILEETLKINTHASLSGKAQSFS